MCSTIATAHDFEVGGIYYNILSEEDKTVEVTFKGSSYSEYSNEYTGSVVIPETVTKSEIITTILGTFDAWTSTNKSNSTTSQTSYTLNVAAGNILKFDWSVSSESNYDWLIITLDGTEIVKKSGTLSGSYEKTFDTSGSHTLVVRYTKDGSQSSGNDEGKIYNITLGSVGSVNDVVYRVTSIGNSAFYNCEGLTSIEIPNSVERIGDNAFDSCSSLTSVAIGNSVTSIGVCAFYNCTGLTSVEIPNSVTSIENSAFNGCSGLTGIVIPNKVTSIGTFAFQYCYRLASIVVDEGNTVYDSRDNCNAIIYTASNAVVLGCYNTTIPNSVTSIGGYAFSGCFWLRSIEIPNGVTSIRDGAFYQCYELSNIVIPCSVTYIGYNAFGLCEKLTNVTSHILADNLFYTNAFDGLNLDACTLYVPYGAKATYASTYGWNGFTNIVEMRPDEITVTINEYGCATYCSPHSLDFSNVEGLKAYAATGYKTNSQVVTLTRVQTAEAGVGLFLKGEPGEYVVPVIESTDEHSLNMLVGTLKQTTVNSTDGAMSNYKFTIADGDTAPMFYPFEDNTTLSAGKAYLQIPTAWLPSTAQKSLSIRFDDGETTDIDELKGESGKLKGENGEVKTIYDLQGRVVENPTSGIYIINGKKVVVK